MKLKPCPLCGGEAITESRFVSYEGVVTIRHDVICNGCGCKIENFQSKEQAINRWNRREPIDKIVEQLEESSYWTDPYYDEDGYSDDDSDEVVLLDKAIEIVKSGGKV